MQKKQMLEAADEKLSDMPESILTQAAVSGVKAEYEAMGEDLDAIQMNYIRTSGIQMVLMALVIMLAAVSVTFLSARVAAALDMICEIMYTARSFISPATNIINFPLHP